MTACFHAVMQDANDDDLPVTLGEIHEVPTHEVFQVAIAHV